MGAYAPGACAHACACMHLLGHDLLRVARVGHRLVLIVGEHDVTELVIGDVLDESPLDLGGE